MKFSGAGNDFLIGEVPSSGLPDAQTIVGLLHRTYGIGADGLILVDLRTPDLPVMHLFNQDGSRAEMSGNGLRSLGHYLVARRGGEPSLSIQTDVGLRRYQLIEAGDWAWTAETTMGNLIVKPESSERFFVDVGNPHRVIVLSGGLQELEALDLENEGAQHQADVKGGINVEWIVRSEDGCVMRVYERGVGPTMACGTGSVAAASVAQHLGWASDQVVVENPGGELVVRFAPLVGDGSEREVWLRGPTVLIADFTPAEWLVSL